ncbi:hypothetical protein [uncultured Nonlabens sp.]|uniref:hypothetical protein n=1 Tax=uncultured Nonlabens sp. TaxID=859306 RepID=UPI002631782A|nr:hypothetical protein [uncultured Nonlabens sp.]
MKMNEEELYEQAWWRLDNTVSQGTTAIDIKSDYGSIIKGVMKIIIVISRFKKSGTSSNHDLPIKSAFLGAHTFPL